MADATTIGLVGCAAAKLSRPAPARDLYTSQLFRKASAYAAATCDQWFILSAKHGLVHPDTVLDPYDMKLGRVTYNPETTAPPIHAWASMVREQLVNTLPDDAHVTVIAGEQYRYIVSPYTRFAHPFPWPHTVPMKGMGIGQQLGWLTTQLRNLDAAQDAS